MPQLPNKLKSISYDLKNFPSPTPLDIQKAEVAALTCKTNKEFCEFLDIDELTFNIWNNKSSAYYKAVSKWKDAATKEIEKALAKRAVGFTKKTKKDVITRAGTIETLVTETYYPPDTAATQFWLKNRAPEEWKDKSEVDVNVQANIRAWLVAAEADTPLLNVTPGLNVIDNDDLNTNVESSLNTTNIIEGELISSTNANLNSSLNVTPGLNVINNSNVDLPLNNTLNVDSSLNINTNLDADLNTNVELPLKDDDGADDGTDTDRATGPDGGLAALSARWGLV